MSHRSVQPGKKRSKEASAASTVGRKTARLATSAEIVLAKQPKVCASRDAVHDKTCVCSCCDVSSANTEWYEYEEVHVKTKGQKHEIVKVAVGDKCKAHGTIYADTFRTLMTRATFCNGLLRMRSSATWC